MFQSKSLRFFKNVQSKRTKTIFQKMPDSVRDIHFSVLDIAISVVQQHFIKLTLNVSK